jgi:flagellum-specific ATP synthase
MMAMMDRIDLTQYLEALESIELFPRKGEVAAIVGLLVESSGPAAALGDIVEFQTQAGKPVRAQIIGFRAGRVLSMPLENFDGLQPGDPVIARPSAALAPVGPKLLGRVLDGFGQPMDGLGRLEPETFYPLYTNPPGALEREHISERLVTGIRAIDGILPCGEGQRIGIFGGSGVGKSTLLGCMSRDSGADVSVIAMIGERNREVRGFIEHELGPEGMKRSIVVVATSDQPAPLRVRACFVAIAIAEYFRDQGKNVLLVMDSVTRLAMAQREIGLASGEPPSQKGYTPSVFALLPKIFERAGNFDKGSITGFFTVLVEGDDFNEPVCDAVRGILDGHIILSRRLADGGHYPAIDILSSVSRLSSKLVSRGHLENIQLVRQALSEYARSEDLIQLGAHVSGVNRRLDTSIAAREQILSYLRQDCAHPSSPEETVQGLTQVAELLR